MRSRMRSAPAALFAILVAAGCHHAPPETPTQMAAKDRTEYEAEIRQVVKDSSRAEQLVALTNEFGHLIDSMVRDDKAAHAQVAALNADYGATRAQYDAVLTRARAERRAAAARLVSLRVRMGAVTTDAEWAELKKYRVKVFDADVNAIQQ